jgi:hypothetical protein
MWEGAMFFRRLLDAPIAKKCIENPIIHKYAKQVIGRDKDQIVHPYHFGHLEHKSTCLWLEGLPPLAPTNDVKHYMKQVPKMISHKVHHAQPGPDRWKERSRTPTGLAIAMGEQWG